MPQFKKACVGALAVASNMLAAQAANLTYYNDSIPLPQFVNLNSGVVIGALYKPAEITDLANIAVFVMHAEQDYTEFTACANLAARGFQVFCANNEASKSGYMTDLNFEDMMTAVGTGVSWLRNQTDIEKVVLLGHSGGGAMISDYQNIAENGASACNGSEKIYPCSSAMADLAAADGVILMDANYGLSTMTLLSLNPAIEDETSGMKINETVDLYSPSNGWTSSGANYTTAFAKEWQSAVAARWNRIIDFAQERLALIEAGNGSFTDDEELYIPDALYTGNNNKFFTEDTNYLAHTVYPWPLLHKNESTTTEIVHSVRVAQAIPSIADEYLNGALKTTIRRFLSTFAIRVTDDFGYNATSFTGIDWTSGHMVPIGAVPGIHVPLLTMGMTGHYEYLNAEKIYLASGSNDTSIAFVEGAQHTIDTCTACETYPGEYGNTTVTAFDFVAGWLAKSGRFL